MSNAINSIASGIGSIFGGDQTGQDYQTAQGIADPWAKYRGQFGQMLSQFMQNPSAVLPNLPGYQFQLGQGINAASGSAAANGMLHSGNTLSAIEQFGQGLASSYGNTYFNQLSQLAGTNIDPTTGAELGLKGAMTRQAGQMGGIMDIGNGLASLFTAG